MWAGLKVTVSSLVLQECFRDLVGRENRLAVCSQNKQHTASSQNNSCSCPEVGGAVQM